MRVIGILGGVASGKSLVARQLAELGAGVLDADRAGHEVLRDPEIEAAARRRWGEKVFGTDGRIDRSRLGQIVFGPGAEKERKYLEELTHPAIGRRLADEARRLQQSGTSIAVLDAPLLLEAGWDSLCSTLVYVEAPREIRLGRAVQRGWSEEEFSAREAAQEPPARKRARADTVIDGSGSPEHARTQVEQFWRELVE